MNTGRNLLIDESSDLSCKSNVLKAVPTLNLEGVNIDGSLTSPLNYLLGNLKRVGEDDGE